jgi:hypothetical protein
MPISGSAARPGFAQLRRHIPLFLYFAAEKT